MHRFYTAAFRGFESLLVHYAGVAQLAECQPSKLDVVGSTPIARSLYSRTRLTRLVGRMERHPFEGSLKPAERNLG